MEEQKHIYSGLPGYGGSVHHRRLIHNLRARRLPSEITKWVQSFLQAEAHSYTSTDAGGRYSKGDAVSEGAISEARDGATKAKLKRGLGRGGARVSKRFSGQAE